MLRFDPDIIPDNVARGAVNEARKYTAEEYGGNDMFGVPWVYSPVERGSIEPPGYTMMDDICDWEDVVKFPDISAFDWEGCRERNKDYLNTDKLISSTIYTGFFERLISYVGFEDAAVAMIDEDAEDAIHALFTKLSDLYIDLIGRLHNTFGTEHIYLHDDWGTQKSTFFSADRHKEMIVPYVTKVVQAAHEMGVFVEMHSCGCISTLLPNLFSTGIDSWRGQPKVNDKYALVQKYGKEFKFGVEIAAPDHEVTDEEADQIARDFAEQYKGANIWIFLTRGFTPQQMSSMFHIIYEGFGQNCPVS
ncbi:MAG: methyltransferase [Blautia sp.]|nr:methyltransferase [Blautia sp.]